MWSIHNKRRPLMGVRAAMENFPEKDKKPAFAGFLSSGRSIMKFVEIFNSAFSIRHKM